MSLIAACDDMCRFTYVSVAAPCGTHDEEALSRTSLRNLIDNLPFGYFLIGDNAFVPSEHLVAILGGRERLFEDNNNFNYYASQLRIRLLA